MFSGCLGNVFRWFGACFQVVCGMLSGGLGVFLGGWAIWQLSNDFGAVIGLFFETVFFLEWRRSSMVCTLSNITGSN